MTVCVRPRGRNARPLRHPTHAGSVTAFRQRHSCRGILAIPAHFYLRRFTVPMLMSLRPPDLRTVQLSGHEAYLLAETRFGEILDLSGQGWGVGNRNGTFLDCSRSPGTYQEEGTIPQALLPLIADGATRISDSISVVRENGQWTYFCGVLPVFQHAENDRRSFRMFTAQLICQGACRQVDIVRAFGVSKNSVIRSVESLSRRRRRNVLHAACRHAGPRCMTPEVTAQAQQLLGAGWSTREVAEQLGLKLDTLRKAIQQGRLTEPGSLQLGEPTPENPPASQPPVPTDKSTRAALDAAAEMGTACTRPDERVLAAFGFLNGASTRFETCRDVSFGGVLCALPALAENGLFRHIHDCLATVAWLLQHSARDCPVGPHGAVPDQGRRAVAVPAPGRVGQAVGAGPRS